MYKFYDRNNLKDVVDLELLVKGARIAQEPDNLYTLSLTPAEFKAIKDEKESGFWQQSKDLKVTILTTACAAITQYVRLAGSHIIFRLQLILIEAGSSPRSMRVQKAGSMTCHPKEKTGRSPIYYWVALLMLRLGYREVLCELPNKRKITQRD